MTNTAYNVQLEKLCAALGLGTLVCAPTPLTGGHLHRMYAIETGMGKYAVKALNPQVMQRPEAKPNVLKAEQVARIAAKEIPAVPAIEFACGIMPEIDGQHYLVFGWIDGAPRYHDEIDTSHCAAMGKLLAQLHGIDFSSVQFEDDPPGEMINWTAYGHPLLHENIADICRWNECLLAAQVELSTGKVVSHRDLEPKNVMWNAAGPVVIDWEAAALIHPLQELVMTALYWSYDANGAFVSEKFRAFVRAYHEHTSLCCDDWQPVLYMGIAGTLGWLEYSFKRALGLECADEAERQMGETQVAETIAELRRYEENMGEVLTELKSAQNHRNLAV